MSLALSPAALRRPKSLRDRLEAAVERLLAVLDAMDGDPDLEPSLGAGERPWPTDQRWWAEGATDGREDACEGEGDWDEREPEHGF